MIDATRGKPNARQVALSEGLLAPISVDELQAYKGADLLNYGGGEGLAEMKALFASILDVQPENVIVGGNSSLTMMFDMVSNLVNTGLWIPGKSKILCPSPGYDRHFTICEHLKLEMITIPMTQDGPDMDKAEEMVKDPNVAGIWCVPIFSNPQGCVYSADTVRRLAEMKTANPNFKILWDNAYAMHHFQGSRQTVPSILAECTKNGYENRPILFTSFSKITIPGAAVSCLAASVSFLDKVIRPRIFTQTIGPDKINQYRHIKMFNNLSDIENHMAKHAEILRPKFKLVDDMFKQCLSKTGATFGSPDGGYFISVDTPPNKAKKVEALCKESGLLITNAGATFPYGKDPNDSNIRFAPTFLSLEQLQQAAEIFCSAVSVAIKT